MELLTPTPPVAPFESVGVPPPAPAPPPPAPPPGAPIPSPPLYP